MKSKQTGYSDPIFPRKVGGFTLVKRELADKKSRHVYYATYRNPSGLIGFAKIFIGPRTHPNYHLIASEINFYKNFGDRILSSPQLAKDFPDISIPRYIYSEITPGRMILILSLISGAHLGTVSVTRRVSIYLRVLQYISALTGSVGQSSLSLTANRPNWYWLFIMPFISLAAIVRNSQHALLIIQGLIVFYLQAPFMISDSKFAFVHRDLGNWNVLVQGKKIWVYDFQLSTHANPLLDIAVLLLKNWEDREFIRKFMSSEHIVSLFRDSISVKVLRALSICISIYDLSQSDGGPVGVSQKFLKYSVIQQS